MTCIFLRTVATLFSVFLIACGVQSVEELPTNANTGTVHEAKPTKIKPVIGYSNTPYIPGTRWRVHDIERPRPEAVSSEVVVLPPPSDALVLFGGKDLSQWHDGKGKEAVWTVEDSVLTTSRPDKADGTVGRRRHIVTRRKFGDVQLHLEWRAPQEISAASQGRGNSGVIFMERYEIQILDSYKNPTYADGQAASLYGWKPPLVNATSPTSDWQSYDIIFEAPRWDVDGNLLKKARATVLHNGVLVHHAQDYLGKTAHKIVASFEQHAEKAPIKLQDHGDAVSFRNIWVRELDFTAND